MKVFKSSLAALLLLLSVGVSDGFSTVVSHRRHHASSLIADSSSYPLRYFDRSNNNRGTRLQMSDVAQEETDDSVISDKNVKRQARLQIGYTVTSVVYLGISILHVIRKGLNSWALYYACGGPLLASGVTYVLKGAASNDRLSSDTYKRLNLSLLTFGVLGLALPVLDPVHFQTPVFIVPPLLATINSIKGYGYGVLGWDKKKEKSAILTDLKEHFQSTFQSLITFKRESLDYLLATAMVVAMTLIKGKELIVESPANPLMVASKVSRMARLLLFSGVLYTLKDAADRNRLSGTSFVQLNYLSSAVFLSMAGYLCPNFKATPLGGAALVFSMITAWNGYSNAKKKA